MPKRPAEQLVNSTTSVLDHLLQCGEASFDEIEKLDAREATDLLESDGYVVRRDDIWVVTSQLLGLLPVTGLTELTRLILFSRPDYRRYLVAVISAEIARRGLEGAMTQVEAWLLQDLFHLAEEINHLLDRLEGDYLHRPLKTCSPGDLLKNFKFIIAQIKSGTDINLDGLNKALLGVSGDQESVFQAIIARQALAPVRQNPIAPSIPDQTIGQLNDELSTPLGRPVFFPLLALDEIGTGDGVLQGESGWIRRDYIYSSLPFRPCTETAGTASQRADENALRDAFTQHPIPWILIQLGIYQYVQQAAGGGLPSLRLSELTNEHRSLADIRLELDGKLVGCFLELLPELLSLLGWHLVLPFGQIQTGSLDRLMSNMVQASIFERTPKGTYTLTELFKQTLFERPHYQRLNKGVKRYRESMIRRLEETRSNQTRGRDQ